jgi:hypothetical protein
MTANPLVWPFKRMAAAPLDGSLIEVRYGPEQEIQLARWSSRDQRWVRDGDRKPLPRVTAWRHVKKWDSTSAAGSGATVIRPE